MYNNREVIKRGSTVVEEANSTAFYTARNTRRDETGVTVLVVERNCSWLTYEAIFKVLNIQDRLSSSKKELIYLFLNHCVIMTG